MHLPSKQAGTRLARPRKDSITGAMRNRLTTIGPVALGLGKIMVKEALTRTNSDLAPRAGRGGQPPGRIRNGGRGWIELPGGTHLKGLSGNRYGPSDTIAIPLESPFLKNRRRFQNRESDSGFRRKGGGRKD